MKKCLKFIHKIRKFLYESDLDIDPGDPLGLALLEALVKSFVLMWINIAQFLGVFILALPYAIFEIIVNRLRYKYIIKKLKEHEKELLDNHKIEHWLLTSIGSPTKLSGLTLMVPRGLSLEDFIMLFLRTYNKEYENKICDKGRRRSLGDLYCICLCYFPNIKIIDVLIILVRNVADRQIGCGWCSTIHKYVFHNNGLAVGTTNKMEWCEGISYEDLQDVVERYCKGD